MTDTTPICHPFREKLFSFLSEKNDTNFLIEPVKLVKRVGW
jgi:hypothetical protein